MVQPSTTELILKLQEQLSVARNEICNLRQQVKSLSYLNKKKVKDIETAVKLWKCEDCKEKEQSTVSTTRTVTSDAEGRECEQQVDPYGVITFEPVGTIRTDFQQKRGIPRQPGIGCQMQGKVVLNNKVFTNPEHALEGLEGFSHMWILFNFHRNGSKHVKAKVSPPRLNGIRTGVFGTRSPHRPCSIGLSLVQIDQIDGVEVYFSGVDMLDGTPVLDLKPYIPLYDNPMNLMKTLTASVNGERDVVNALIPSRRSPVSSPESDCSHSINTILCDQSENYQDQNISRNEDSGEREAPDGEESGQQPVMSLTSGESNNVCTASLHLGLVRVPDWVSDPPVAQLIVTFNKNVEEQLDINMRNIITSILKEDPRSVYIRERYGNQFYTFLIQDYHVSCKFYDSTKTVNVYRVSPAENLCSCGILEWQCSQHHRNSE